MLLITSAAYAPAELVSELGQLPPSFLPLGNRRLYARQLATLSGLGETILLSLPQDYALEAHDAEQLQASGVHIVRTPPQLSLVQSLSQLLAANPLGPDEALRILHGDTLQSDLPLTTPDVLAIAANDGYYPRAHVECQGEHFTGAEYRYCHPGDSVLTGYMAFGDAALFAQVLSEVPDYISAINRYHALRPGGMKVHRTSHWADCGHVNAYYRSRARHTTERVFNELSVQRHYIRKRGEDERKIAAELDWFRKVPPALRHYLPQLGSSGTETGDTYYDIEYLYALPLSDLFVFGALPVEDWETIFSRCLEFLSDCSAYPGPAAQGGDWSGLYLPKTLQRLQAFALATGWLVDAPTRINGQAQPALTAMAEAAQRVIALAPKPGLTFGHGDFCFSNILYDARARRIKVIDPRGLTPEGQPASYGELRYDFAKLFHSAIGAYDLVMAEVITGAPDGQNALIVNGVLHDRADQIAQQFRRSCLAAMNALGGERLIAAITVQLFLSMLPLHRDKPHRQLALISRAADVGQRYQIF